MNNILKYKGFYGTVEYSADDNILFGKVIGINGLISYEGKSVDELRTDFEESVDDYIEMCAEKNIKPEKLYKGSFNVRISPELHRQAVIISSAEHISLNQFIENSVSEKVMEYGNIYKS